MKASLPLSSGMTGPAPGLSSSQFALLMLTMQTFQAKSRPSGRGRGLPGEVRAFRARSGPSRRGRGLPRSDEDVFCVSAAGIAYLGGVCSAKRKCVLAEDNGLNLAFTIAHELGHK